MNDGNIDRVASARGWWAAVALLVCGFLVWTYGELLHATSARWQDTSGYLAHALYIAEHGGFWGFLRECFTGTFPITERHPLYMLMLAPFAERTADFFMLAKWIDLWTGLAVLLSLIWMVARRYGRGAALIAGMLYALSNSLVIASSHVDNEMQFVLCTLWTWWFLTEPAPGSGASDAMPVSRTRWALAGLWLGLAYLAKSPAVLMGVAVVVAGMWHARPRFIADRRLWMFLLVTALLSSPLVVRNLIGFGTPFYEGINSHIMWIDKWTDIGSEQSSIYYDQYGVTTIEANGMPTAADYFRTHSLLDVVKRLGSGFANELTNVIPSALGPSLQIPRYRLIGMGVFVLALAGWWLRRKSWDACLVFFWSAAFLVFFSWDTMFPEIRYLAPLIPVWIAFAAHTIWQVSERVLKSRAFIAVVCALCLTTLGTLGWTTAKGAYNRPQSLMEASPSYLRFVDWLNNTLESGDRIMIGETREFHGLIWMVKRPVGVVLMPDADSLDGFLRYLRERKVRYLLMHAEYLTGTNRRLAGALEPYFAVQPDGAFIERQRLPGWHPVYADDPAMRHFIVYEPDTYAAQHQAAP
ncbi:MAG: ArnT family glycosyltransferase [Steroidobacteraceae bacterium]